MAALEAFMLAAAGAGGGSAEEEELEAAGAGGSSNAGPKSWPICNALIRSDKVSTFNLFCTVAMNNCTMNMQPRSSSMAVHFCFKPNHRPRTERNPKPEKIIASGTTIVHTYF